MLSAGERLLARFFALALAACGRVPMGDPPRSLVPAAATLPSLEGEARPALPGSTFQTTVQLPDRPFLTFAVGIREMPGAFPSAAPVKARFSVRAETNEIYRRDFREGRAGVWIEQSVDLRRFAGRVITLTFQSSLVGEDGRSADSTGGRFSPVIADVRLHDRARYGKARPVVLISIDTLRRDHVSLYGYRRKTTPALDELADESVVFEDAVSTSSWTLPAHASLLTSLYPTAHGATTLERGLPAGLPSLPTLLREGGFFTEALVTHVYLSAAYGFAHYFERHRTFEEMRAKELTDRAIGFLRARGDEDFFLFLHYYDPHWHYDPPPPYNRTFDPGYYGRATGVWWDFKKETANSISAKDLEHIVSLYDGEILYTDREIARLFREMKRLDLWKDSVIVVTSDHGEEFLDHGSWEHQKTLYEEQIRIPLLVKLPGALRRRIAAQVRLIDVAPTLLEALGLEVPASFQGRSLLARARGDAEASPREAWAETEHTTDDSHKVTLRRGASGEKVVASFWSALSPSGVEGSRPARVELYRLQVDPGEKHDLGTSQSSSLRRMETFLLESRRVRERGPRTPRIDLSPEAISKLKALGYVR